MRRGRPRAMAQVRPAPAAPAARARRRRASARPRALRPPPRRAPAPATAPSQVSASPSGPRRPRARGPARRRKPCGAPVQREGRHLAAPGEARPNARLDQRRQHSCLPAALCPPSSLRLRAPPALGRKVMAARGCGQLGRRSSAWRMRLPNPQTKLGRRSAWRGLAVVRAASPPPWHHRRPHPLPGPSVSTPSSTACRCRR